MKKRMSPLAFYKKRTKESGRETYKKQEKRNLFMKRKDLCRMSKNREKEKGSCDILRIAYPKKT